MTTIPAAFTPTEITPTPRPPAIAVHVHLMVRDDRQPTVRVDTDSITHLTIEADDLSIAFTSRNPADIEQALLSALAALRQHTTPTPDTDIETARLELGTRAATGSPLPELEPVGVDR